MVKLIYTTMPMYKFLINFKTTEIISIANVKKQEHCTCKNRKEEINICKEKF